MLDQLLIEIQKKKENYLATYGNGALKGIINPERMHQDLIKDKEDSNLSTLNTYYHMDDIIRYNPFLKNLITFIVREVTPLQLDVIKTYLSEPVFLNQYLDMYLRSPLFVYSIIESDHGCLSSLIRLISELDLIDEFEDNTLSLISIELTKKLESLTNSKSPAINEIADKLKQMGSDPLVQADIENLESGKGEW